MIASRRLSKPFRTGLSAVPRKKEKRTEKKEGKIEIKKGGRKE